MSPTGYAARRLALGAAQVLAVATAVFLLVEALPGDAAVALAGDHPDPARIEAIRAAMGLDRPAWERFGQWLAGLPRLDFGVSLVSGRPVAEFLGDGIGPTLVLAVLTLVLLVPLSVLVGVLAALREGGALDRVLTSVSVALHSIPEFALAVVLIAVFGVRLGWLPPTAVGADVLAEPAVLVLPLVVLLARPICSIGRLVRAGMLDALASEHVRHARRLGIGEARIRFAHALPNALAPAVQQVARTTDWLLGGVIVVEAVFVVPGLGTTLVDAVAGRDLPVVQGLAVVFAITTVTVNLLADLVAFRLAPRTGVTT
ncbi:ABC transporter permease [Saccharothrix longispora]|uniref:ABC transporter permease n=1 Tax=Saccharothrix longispora TaxID=33920 RepID=UPI0028FD4AD7|nr:ABC transporter permease [Saccharothrix longispora]MBY8847626.1 ABC transporter permease [Saccharothrix sp. MB29]MDU0289744.1 ABC transporter permease [Saccharothrix longispora]